MEQRDIHIKSSVEKTHCCPYFFLASQVLAPPGFCVVLNDITVCLIAICLEHIFGTEKQIFYRLDLTTH